MRTKTGACLLVSAALWFLPAAASAHSQRRATPTDTTSPVPLAPGARSIEIAGATLSTSDGIGFALHPTGDPVELHSPQPGLELCPAAAEPDVAAVVAGAPTQPFSCTPFDADGNASAVSPSGGAGHVGLVVRATGATAPRVRALELHYTAVDQFFVVFPPHGDATRMTVRLTPERARIVAAQAFLFPDRRSNGAPAVSLRQGARRLRRTTPVVSLDADCYGPAKLHRSVVVRVAKVPRADETVGLVLQWA